MRLSVTSSNFLERHLFNSILLALLAILYGPIVVHWYDGWLNKSIGIEHEYFSHGLIGLPYAAYIVWQQRKKWQRLESTIHPLGAFLLALGASFYLSGVDQWVYLSLPVVLAGICLWLKGIPGLKLMGFPLILLLLATPNDLPYLITPYTLPLQQFIAAVAAFFLHQAGLNVTVQGIHLAVGDRFIEVAPYCAGLKMLFTSLYVTLMLLHWTGTLKSFKKSAFLLSSAVFISVVANILRNAILAWFHGTKQDGLFDWLHEGWGGDIYSVLMLVTIVILFRIVEKVTFKMEPKQSLEKSQSDNIL